MRRLAALCSILAIALLAAFAPPAASAPVATIAPSLHVDAVAPGDTFRLVASWPAVVDGNALPPSYVVAWRYHKYPVNTAFPTNGPTKTITATADSLSLAMPNYPDSMWVEVKVTATRSGYNAATTTATRFFRKPNPTPPPVPSITLDTASSS